MKANRAVFHVTPPRPATGEWFLNALVLFLAVADVAMCGIYLWLRTI